ncbi:transaldolase, partial [PVC group bacterium]|nr:transaldolase [PVC group bacterium]
VEEAKKHFEELDLSMIDYDEVTQNLEDAGVASFKKSFEDLMASIVAKKEKLTDLIQKQGTS